MASNDPYGGGGQWQGQQQDPYQAPYPYKNGNMQYSPHPAQSQNGQINSPYRQNQGLAQNGYQYQNNRRQYGQQNNGAQYGQQNNRVHYGQQNYDPDYGRQNYGLQDGQQNYQSQYGQQNYQLQYGQQDRRGAVDRRAQAYGYGGQHQKRAYQQLQPQNDPYIPGQKVAQQNKGYRYLQQGQQYAQVAAARAQGHGGQPQNHVYQNYQQQGGYGARQRQPKAILRAVRVRTEEYVYEHPRR